MLYNHFKMYSYLLMLLIFVASITTAVFLVTNMSVLYAIHLNLFHPEIFNKYSSYKIFLAYDSIIKYLQSPFINTMNLAPFHLSKSGIFHFLDVKRLILFNNFLMLSSILLLYKMYTKVLILHKRWILIQPLKFLNLFIYLFVVLCLTDFQSFFIFFHKLIFTNDYWIFDSKLDSLINILPMDFFTQSFILIFLFILFVNYLFIAYGKRDIK
ncbi:hypothetical protein FD06_GL001191 [Apilactobacillus ozensis DSM 23829 = JCM 17196]|uniref:Integral membrane protein n=2 Tax=Apilactobacillus ozensis TaxID=866801 RepID=A0A0R2AWF1_9LACO|nr:hypothetical protein FD06_GL001191 [Apilactobacillus ozensis DSM 23829 = JCM 17196]